jgi:Tfp pilus assembly protein PilN
MSRASTKSADTVGTLMTGHVLPRVNLLPPEVHVARKLRKLQLGLGAGVAVVAVAVGGLYVVATHANSQAKSDLAGVTATNSALQAQKAKYDSVPQTEDALTAARTARSSAMADDIQWYRYLNDLSYITPKNAWLTQVTIATSTGTATPATNSTGAATTSPAVATVTFTGDAKAHTDVAAWLDAIAKEHGWMGAYFTNSAVAQINGQPGVTFSSSVQVTSDALSHRYDGKGN